jgi:hypothetical protein
VTPSYARTLARRAVQKGVRKKEPCEICGDNNAVAHHLDYSQPLDVHWLCAPHHIQLHALMRQQNPRARDRLSSCKDQIRTIEDYSNPIGWVRPEHVLIRFGIPESAVLSLIAEGRLESRLLYLKGQKRGLRLIRVSSLRALIEGLSRAIARSLTSGS